MTVSRFYCLCTWGGGSTQMKGMECRDKACLVSLPDESSQPPRAPRTQREICLQSMCASCSLRLASHCRWRKSVTCAVMSEVCNFVPLGSYKLLWLLAQVGNLQQGEAIERSLKDIGKIANQRVMRRIIFRKIQQIIAMFFNI